MPVPLPAPLEVPIQSIAPLQQPADPPTADDVVNATRYVENVLCSHGLGNQVTDEEACAALEYQHLIISAKTTAAAPVAAVAPGWFQIAVDQFNARFDRVDAKFRRINTRLREQRAAIRAVDELVQELQYDIGEVKENLGRMERIGAIALNRS